MNFKNIKRYMVGVALIAATSLTSCVHQLDTVPVDPNVNTKENTYTDLYSYQMGLSKLYAGYAVTGQKGPDGNGDLGGIDEGASQYLRRWWEAQELPTDEAINGWADPGQPEMSFMTWGVNNTLNEALYYRIIYQVTLCNQYLRDTKDAPFEEVRSYRAQARFLRAFSYWHALDIYGNGVPFVTEENAIGSDLPLPAGKVGGRELFDFITGDLLSIISNDSDEHLQDVGQGLVGQANKGAAWMLLAKLYLNAEVYINENYIDEAQKYTDMVVNSYSLVEAPQANSSAYQSLFLADNYLQHNEIIFAINFDGNNTQTWGGMTYLICAAVGGNDMDPKNYGIGGGWGGNRSMLNLYDLFLDQNGNQNDARGMFFTGYNKPVIEQYNIFTEGVQVEKFKNLTTSGNNGSNPTFVDTNFPIFRMADALLMQTEILWRKGTQDKTNIQRLWSRAGRIGSVPEITAKFILDERARELYWEGHRRTDLRRFNEFTVNTDVNPWQFKGGIDYQQGKRDMDAKYELYPIPGSEVGSNPNLIQNPGY